MKGGRSEPLTVSLQSTSPLMKTNQEGTRPRSHKAGVVGVRSRGVRAALSSGQELRVSPPSEHGALKF